MANLGSLLSNAQLYSAASFVSDGTLLIVLAALIGVMSVVAFILYAADKSRAKRGKWRIPEKVLLLVGVFGGALGALLGMFTLRHKTKHAEFYIVNVFSIISHIAAVAAVICFMIAA